MGAGASIPFGSPEGGGGVGWIQPHVVNPTHSGNYKRPNY